MDILYQYNNIIFEWDSDKADKVLKDHKITMQEACTVFFDDMAIHQEDDRI
ncbi:MAG: BrnT family toxin [Gammaproteobacteria bacterium]|nr:BrnT family toxin [Gammaproteobacteria bacterium]